VISSFPEIASTLRFYQEKRKMLRNTRGLLIYGLFTVILGIAPLAAQTQPATSNSTNSTTSTTTTTQPAKKARKKSTAAADSSTASAPAVASSSPATGKTPAPAAPAAAAPPQKGMVWVNTASGVYHVEGAKYYGKTKQGKYMTEADAQKAGYHIAKGEAK
jgi:cytoskeletal protein RodZ